jgi:hypothetical protein
LEQELSSNRLKLETQVSELQGLTYSNDSLTAELQSLRQKDEFRRDLMTDLSTELSLTASRESKLQVEVEQLKERSIAEEITIESLGSRERSIPFEIDDLHKELEEAAVREALLECEIAEAKGERDALREKTRADQAQERFSRRFDEHGTILLDDHMDISSLLPPSDELQADTRSIKEVSENGDKKMDKKDASAQCPIQ